jgi:hypothetical protein
VRATRRAGLPALVAVGTLVLLVVAPSGPGALARAPALIAAGPASAASRAAAGVPPGAVALSGNWTNLTSAIPTSPPRQCCGAMAYDAASQDVVYFGGSGLCGPCNDTWAFAQGTWRNLTPGLSISPPARTFSSMAYDPALSGVVLFGGLLSSGGGTLAAQDTWLFSDGSWTQLFPVEAPSARYSAAMSWDAATNTLLLFGGFNSRLGFLGDTWEFAKGDWTPVATLTAPAARWGAAMAYDDEDQCVVLYGGYNGTSGYFADTWSWNGTAWAALPSSGSPPAREKAVMAYDPSTDSLVLFGGDVCPVGCFAGPGTVFLGDTWSFQGGSWTNLTSTAGAGPSPRCCSASAYDGATGEFLVTTGGNAPGLVYQGMWGFGPAHQSGLVITSTPISPSSPVAGEGWTIEVGVAGGSGVLSYSYSGLPAGCGSLNASEIYCVPSQAGPDVVTLSVTDSTGGHATATVSFDVLPAPAPPPPPPPPGFPTWVLAVVVVGAAVLVSIILILPRWRSRSRAGGRSGSETPVQGAGPTGPTPSTSPSEGAPREVATSSSAGAGPEHDAH